MDNTKNAVAIPDHYVITAAEYHAIVDAIRVEAESLISHQPGSAGCVVAGRKLSDVAQRLEASATPAYDTEEDASAAADASEATDAPAGGEAAAPASADAAKATK